VWVNFREALTVCKAAPYVDDAVEAVVRLARRVPAPDPDWTATPPTRAPYRLYNIGNNAPVKLTDFIAVLEGCLGRTAIKRLVPPQPGDVPATYADIADLARDTGFAPATPLEVGLERFVRWYREFYGA
jgi:UDP-glucuronate 4-epimerase